MPEHRARKRFGQNFLHDPSIIQQIITVIAPKPGQHLVEIGPGQGALTGELLASGCQLDAIELDRDLVPLLLQRFADNACFSLQQGDALQFDFHSLGTSSKPLRVVGNLPYNISTPLLFHLLAQRQVIADMHFMLQKEVVDRLAAQPGQKNYGRLSVMAQYYCRVESLLDVPPGAFQPAPKVQSAVVRLVPFAELPHPTDSDTLQLVVRSAFSQRRKTLRNNLKNVLDSEVLTTLDIDPGARAETLSLAEFVRISNYLVEHSN